MNPWRDRCGEIQARPGRNGLLHVIELPFHQLKFKNIKRLRQKPVCEIYHIWEIYLPYAILQNIVPQYIKYSYPVLSNARGGGAKLVNKIFYNIPHDNLELHSSVVYPNWKCSIMQAI